MAFCASCGKQTGPDDRFCEACGTPVAVLAQTPPAVVYCAGCGRPTRPGHDFCDACGTPLRANVSVPQAQVQPALSQQYAQVPRTIPPPLPAKRKNYLWLWLGLGFSVAGVIVILILLTVFGGPQPENSLYEARMAYLQHDQASFDKYVDVNSVLSDWTNQGVNVWLKQQNAGPIESAAAQIIAGTLKSVYLPSVAQSVDQLVVTGTLPDQSQTDQNDQTTVFVSAFMSSILHSIATSQLTYQGVQTKTVTNDNAELTVSVTSSLSSQPISVRIKMRRDGDHWRVTAVEDLAGLLNQISPATTP